MLRPATPLALIFFVAFVLLLLSTLSAPIIQAIPLATVQGWNLGVFGLCKGSKCVGPKIGYSTESAIPPSPSANFDLSTSTRHSLSSILIVHPIAAFLTLVCFGLAVAAHFHSAAHSPRYLLALLILTIPTLLLSLLAFLVDILLFVPHVQWGGWIVLAATILIICSTVVTCAMRRTLVSRKARKKRIAENPEMNGANYYNNLNETRLMTDQLPRADSPPPMSGTTATNDKTDPQFASFEMKSQDGGRRSMDDRTPLNPTRDPSVRSASTGGGRRVPYGQEGEVPPVPMNGRPSMDSQARPRRPSRDQYGNPIAAGATVGAVGAMGAMAASEFAPPLRHQNSHGSMASNQSRGSARGRGGMRGGYGPPPRGYGPPRGSYGPDGRGRGGYGPRGAFRGGPPPPGWNGRGRGAYGGPPPPSRGMGMRGGMRPAPPPGYNIDSYYGDSRSNSSPSLERQPMNHIDAGQDLAIGQAIEMDERTGSLSPPGPQSPAIVNPNSNYDFGLRDSDADVNGMVGLQQERISSPMRGDGERESGIRSETSIYSDQTYVPPRAQWSQPAPVQQHYDDYANSSNPTISAGVPSSNALPLSPIQASPTSQQHSPRAPLHTRNQSETYYEDVDPRFAVDEQAGAPQFSDPHPHALTPGAATPGAITAGAPGAFPATPGTHQYAQPFYPMPNRL